jgi:DHA2 family methylenomycin A resistance protein-like MFS transporter
LDFWLVVAQGEAVTKQQAERYGPVCRNEPGEDTPADAVHAAPDVAAAPAGPAAWLSVVVVAGGLFLAVASGTVVSVALPRIGSDLHASATDLQWVVDAFVLVYASLLVPGGVVGDRRGRKGVFLLGGVLFGLGALVAGLAPSVGPLLLGRVVQGIGPALLIPGSLTIIRATFDDPGQRAAAIGLWSTSSGLAMAVGPALGGVIVDALGWRWVFLLNVPASAVLVLLAARFVPHLPRVPARHPFDWVGAVLSTAGVAAFVFAVIHGQDVGWVSPPVPTACALAVAALVAFVAWERRRAEPLVDVALFRRPAFTAANLSGLVVFFAFVGAVVYFSAYFQQVQGHSAVRAGLDVSAIGVAFALTAPISGRLVGRIGPFRPMVAGLVVSGLATFGLLRLGTDTGIGAIWWDFALVGFGIGLCLTPMTTTAVSAVEPSRAGMASAVHNALRQLGQALGVAVLGALVYGYLPSGHSAGQHLDPAQASLFVHGLHNALWVSGLALLAAAAAVLLYAGRRNGSDPA